MIKFYAFLLSCLTFLLVTTPAYAGRLLFWRYEANQNRLLFTTDQGIQPTAQLIANPTRLVIDLPGTTLGRPTINETYGGLITSLRIGQFDARTTRLVIELAPGYILDPNQIKIKGLSPTQWSVELPTPQRGNFPSSTPSSPSDPNNSSSINNSSNTNNSNNPSPNTNANNNNSRSNTGGVQVTTSGLIVGIDGDHRNRVRVDRSRDRKKINFEISNINLSNEMLKSWAINQYGVENIEITQKRNSVALLTLNVHPDSPDWQGTFSRMGGFVLWPQGGISRVLDLPSSANKSIDQPTTNNSPRNTINNNNRKTLIETIEINDNQLVIRGNQAIRGEGSWGTGNQVYQLRMENTGLAPNFQSPNLPSGSPISRLRIWQPDDNTVVLLIEPALGTRISGISQTNERVLTLPMTGLRSSQALPLNPRPLPPANNPPSNNSQNVTPIPVTPAPNSLSPFDITPSDNTRSPLPTNNPAPAPNRPVTNSRAVVMIDPGHGGRDPGAVGIGGLQEKHVVLTISQQVARILEQQGIQVRMTRDSDYFVSLEGRTQMANRINADLFVSIHANSAGANRPEVSGYETYYFDSRSKSLADTIHRNVIRRVDVRDRRVKQARFYVLRTARMPSVLLELGFVTGREDAAKLTNPAFQRQMAEAIAAGIVEYIRTNRL